MSLFERVQANRQRAAFVTEQQTAAPILSCAYEELVNNGRSPHGDIFWRTSADILTSWLQTVDLVPLFQQYASLRDEPVIREQPTTLLTDHPLAATFDRIIAHAPSLPLGKAATAIYYQPQSATIMYHTIRVTGRTAEPTVIRDIFAALKKGSKNNAISVQDRLSEELEADPIAISRLSEELSRLYDQQVFSPPKTRRDHLAVVVGARFPIHGLRILAWERLLTGSARQDALSEIVRGFSQNELSLTLQYLDLPQSEQDCIENEARKVHARSSTSASIAPSTSTFSSAARRQPLLDRIISS